MLIAQALLDLITCFLTAALAAHLAPEPQRRRVRMAALWLAATCPFVANYAAVPLSEVLATFLTALALVCLLRAAMGERDDFFAKSRIDTAWKSWFLGGLLARLGALVRPETPLFLAAVGLVLAGRWRRPADWPKLGRAGTWMAAGLILPLLPWGARNGLTLRHAQFLAPRYAEQRGEPVPRGFYAWTGTWLVRFRDVYVTL